ncbi:plasma membrane ATPase 3 [Striga asiatica]|uniref:Plasma membrane ATPase 3 n=1 Tax=Striga asiatica TaxID=4170 RepID=A0A5A7PEF7_STRAF|nr:plasma membrane ATPase 3 [Striga asiatica]
MNQPVASKELDIILSGEEVGQHTNVIGEGNVEVLIEMDNQEVATTPTAEKGITSKPKVAVGGKAGASWKRKHHNTGRLLIMSEQPAHISLAIEVSQGKKTIKTLKRNREIVIPPLQWDQLRNTATRINPKAVKTRDVPRPTAQAYRETPLTANSTRTDGPKTILVQHHRRPRKPTPLPSPTTISISRSSKPRPSEGPLFQHQEQQIRGEPPRRPHIGAQKQCPSESKVVKMGEKHEALDAVLKETVDLENIPIEEVFENLRCTREGLSSEGAQERLTVF